MNNFHYA
jgi:hypothetical protein